MKLTAINPTWSWAGGNIDLLGTGFGHHRTHEILLIGRHGSFMHLTPLVWTDTKIIAKIPANLLWGEYEVKILLDEFHPNGQTTQSIPCWLAMGPKPHHGADAWETQVHAYKLKYGKSDDWETFMLASRDRYKTAFDISRPAPFPIEILVKFVGPVQYFPAWHSADEHFQALSDMMNYSYPGKQFLFFSVGDVSKAFAVANLGIPTNNSFTDTEHNMFLYFETIMPHEFAHVLGLHHHYDTDQEIGFGYHMPPGESTCLMDRNSQQFCSACRMAIGLDLNADNSGAIYTAIENILNRYPK